MNICINSNKSARKFALLAFLSLAATAAYASSTTGMPWEGPLQVVINALTGPLAGFLAILGIFGGLLGVLFGGELSDAVKILFKVVFVVSIMAGSVTALSALGIVTSAVV
jgi:type IV secretion system protein VirB2